MLCAAAFVRNGNKFTDCTTTEAPDGSVGECRLSSLVSYVKHSTSSCQLDAKHYLHAYISECVACLCEYVVCPIETKSDVLMRYEVYVRWSC